MTSLSLPGWIETLPSVDTGLPAVAANALRGSALCMFLRFAADTHVPAHRHGGQFGCVILGGLDLIVDGTSHSFDAGSCYEILPGQLHEAWIREGTFLVEFFEEADRY
jgi:hypothetical protein